MTPQLRLLAVGGIAAAIARFYFQRDNKTSLYLGAVAITIVSLLITKPDAPDTGTK